MRLCVPRLPLLTVLLVLSAAPAALAQPAAGQEPTSVAPLIIRAAPPRPPSGDAPRFTTQEIEGLRLYADEMFKVTQFREMRASFSLVRTEVAENYNYRRLASTLSGTEGRKRMLYRRLYRASLAAETATAQADAAFQAYLDKRMSRTDMMEAQKVRETAVLAMLDQRRKTFEGARSADDAAWLTVQDVAMSSDVTGLRHVEQAQIDEALSERAYQEAAENRRAAGPPLTFENVRLRPVTVDGQRVLQVSGLIRNNLAVHRQVPSFSVVFYDQNDRAFGGVTSEPGETVIAGQASQPFVFNVGQMVLVAGVDPQTRVSRAALVLGRSAGSARR